MGQNFRDRQAKAKLSTEPLSYLTLTMSPVWVYVWACVGVSVGGGGNQICPTSNLCCGDALEMGQVS